MNEKISLQLLRRTIAAADKEIVDELRTRAGISVSSITEIVNSRAEYPKAYPILVDLLRRRYPLRIREMIVRALTAKGARDVAFPTLLSIYQDVETLAADINFESFRFATANAICVLASSKERDLIKKLARNAIFGSSRLAFIAAMRPWRDPEVDEIIYDALSDPSLRYQAIVAAGTRRISRALPLLETAASDHDPDTRRAAAKAIERIKRGVGND